MVKTLSNKEILQDLIDKIKEIKRIPQGRISVLAGYETENYLAEVKSTDNVSENVIKAVRSLYEKAKADPAILNEGDGIKLVHRDIKLIEQPKSFREKLQDQKLNKVWNGVPMYDAPISASFVETYRDERIYQPRFFLLDDRFRDCDFGSVIKGDSMHSEIRHGDFVVCKEITDFGFIVFGEIYFIISTNQLETCKYLWPGKADDFLLKAYNKSVPDTPLPRKYLHKLYKVRGILRTY